MKIFKDNEFSCPKGIQATESEIDKNGRQTIGICLKCALDDRGICAGTIIYVVNDFKNNNYAIYKKCGVSIYEIKSEKGSTLDKRQFLKFVKEKYNVERI